MFKRRAAPASQHRQIGPPQLLHTTYDQRLISHQPGLAASSAPSEYFESPFDQLSSSSSLSYRRFDSTIDTGAVFKAAHHRDNSSVYSQHSDDDSPRSAKQHTPIAPQAPRLRQISPTSPTLPFSGIPTINTPDTVKSVTPDANETNTRKGYFGSHIPMLRKQKSSETRQVSSETRWDEYKGEPIRHGEGGKVGQVQPRDFERDLAAGSHYNVHITGGPDRPKKPTWSERAAKMPWKGGAGRTAIVEPVKDTTVSRSSPKFTAVRQLGRGLHGGDSDNTLSLVVSAGSGGHRELSPVSSLGGRYEDRLSSVGRNDSARDFDDKNVSPITTDSHNYFPTQHQYAPQAIRVVGSMDQSASPTSVFRKPVGNLQQSGSRPTSEYPQGEPHDEQDQDQRDWTAYREMSAATLAPTANSTGDGPVSRFSWTTVNTATTYQQDSPPPSPPPVPVPALDHKAWQGVGVATGRSTEKPPTPPPGENEGFQLEPPTSKNMDHVDFLIAQEADLVLRHRTIYKVIRELEKIASASPLDVDWKTMKANKKNLDEKKEQLSIVEREQHELGLAIARARRKAEREDGIESGLWVRRMGG